MDKTKQAAIEFIEKGGKCIYRYGWAYRGAGSRTISKETALEKIKHYSFGMGFHELNWLNINGEVVLEFNELSENDMW